MAERGATSGSMRGAAWSAASPQRQGLDDTGDPRYWQAAGLKSPSMDQRLPPSPPPPSRVSSRSMAAQPLPSPQKMKEAMATLKAAAESMDGLDRSNYRRAYDELAGALRSSRANYVRMEDFNEDEGSCGAATGRCCEGTVSTVNSFLKAVVATLQMMMLPLGYYVLGIVVYKYLEGWEPLDTAYFLTVTSTTVGYGDMCPTTVLGKIFTTIYALIGITVILGALAPLVAFLRGDWREKLLALLGCGAKVDTNDPNLTMEEVNKLINYPRRYALALLGPGFVMLAGMIFHFWLIREMPEDEADYWSFSREVGALLDALGVGIGGGGPYALEEAMGFDIEIDMVGMVDSFYWVRAVHRNQPLS